MIEWLKKPGNIFNLIALVALLSAMWLISLGGWWASLGVFVGMISHNIEKHK